MSSPNVYNDGFTQTNFINSLGFIPTAYIPSPSSQIGAEFANGPINDILATGLGGNSPTIPAQAEAAFTSFLKQNYPLPQTSDNFFNAWLFSSQATALVNLLNGSTNVHLYQYYAGPSAMLSFAGGSFGLSQVLGIPVVAGQPPTPYPGDDHSDWNILTTPVSPAPNPPITYPTIDMNAQFAAAFTHFLQTYTYPPGGSTLPVGATDASYFFNQWFKFTAVTATLQIAQPPLMTATNQSVTGPQPSYEAIYNTYHPGATRADFQTAMVSFYNDQMAKNGFFLPSQSFSAWVTQNATQYNAAVQGTASFSSVSQDKAGVINRIIKLLIAMIAILQKVGITQANQLTFITAFQNVYVQMQSQVPVFSQGNKYSAQFGGGTTPLGKTGTAADNERNQLNTVFNAAISQNLSSFRGVQESAAKQVQSNVNQTNDAVTQETDMSTSLIQQLSGIIGSIFR